MKTTQRGIALVEALVLIALAAVLTGIAIPNVLAARTRSRLARVVGDHAALAQAIEAYRAGHGTFPPWTMNNRPADQLARGFAALTTPVAYVEPGPGRFADPFGLFDRGAKRITPAFYEVAFGGPWGAVDHVIRSHCEGCDPAGVPRDTYLIESLGPNHLDDILAGDWGLEESIRRFIPYDPSNGLTSYGDLYRMGGRTPGWFRRIQWPPSSMTGAEAGSPGR